LCKGCAFGRCQSKHQRSMGKPAHAWPLCKVQRCCPPERRISSGATGARPTGSTQRQNSGLPSALQY
jgi:hypothetical protein